VKQLLSDEATEQTSRINAKIKAKEFLKEELKKVKTAEISKVKSAFEQMVLISNVIIFKFLILNLKVLIDEEAMEAKSDDSDVQADQSFRAGNSSGSDGY
jgi:fucose permease